jgi:hypothetical protein
MLEESLDNATVRTVAILSRSERATVRSLTTSATNTRKKRQFLPQRGLSSKPRVRRFVVPLGYQISPAIRLILDIDFATGFSREGVHDDLCGRIADEPHAAIAERDVDAARVA